MQERDFVAHFLPTRWKRDVPSNTSGGSHGSWDTSLERENARTRLRRPFFQNNLSPKVEGPLAMVKWPDSIQILLDLVMKWPDLVTKILNLVTLPSLLFIFLKTELPDLFIHITSFLTKSTRPGNEMTRSVYKMTKSGHSAIYFPHWGRITRLSQFPYISHRFVDK